MLVTFKKSFQRSETKEKLAKRDREKQIEREKERVRGRERKLCG